MTEQELRAIEEQFEAGQKYPAETDDNQPFRTQSSFVTPVWAAGVAEVRARALQRTDLTAERYQGILTRYLRVLQRLYEALHANYTSHEANEKPTCFWERQRFDELHLRDAARGIDVDRSDLLDAAAFYLSEPDVRTSKLDWIFLDSIVFTELEEWGDYAFMRRADTETNWAATFAERSLWKYLVLAPLFWLVRIALRFALWPALAYYLYIRGFETWTLVILGLWALYIVLRLLTLPARISARRKGAARVRYLEQLYGMLGERTISPRKLKELVDRGAAAGVTFDNSVFAIVDRIIARDPTVFFPTAPDRWP